MTRTLVLLRHAKSDHPAGMADLDRPLSERGQADARAAGAWLARQAPELVLSSPSKRTRQTWQELAGTLPGKPTVRYDRRIYLGGVADLLELVREIDGSVRRVLVIGHNPTLSQLAFTLDPHGGLDSDGLRTCGLSVHQLAGEWRDCDRGGGPITATHTARG